MQVKGNIGMQETKSANQSDTSETWRSSLSAESLPHVIILKQEVDFPIFFFFHFVSLKLHTHTPSLTLSLSLSTRQNRLMLVRYVAMQQLKKHGPQHTP